MIDTGSLGPSARLHFEMPKTVLKAAKAKACATKIQFAIWSRSGACRLDRSSVSGFDTPVSRSNPEGGMFLWEFAAQPAANYLDGFQDFFFTGDVLALRTSVSHFGSKLFSGLGNVWGEFEVAWPFRLCNCINCTKTDSVLGTMWSPSYRIKFYKFNTILNNSWQIWRAGNKLSAQNFGSALARAYRITEKSAIVNGTSPFTYNLDL